MNTKTCEDCRCFMLNVFGVSLHFFYQPFKVGWAIRLHRKFYSGAAKKLPVKGLKNLLVIAGGR